MSQSSCAAVDAHQTARGCIPHTGEAVTLAAFPYWLTFDKTAEWELFQETVSPRASSSSQLHLLLSEDTCPLQAIHSHFRRIINKLSDASRQWNCISAQSVWWAAVLILAFCTPSAFIAGIAVPLDNRASQRTGSRSDNYCWSRRRASQWISH